MGADARGNWSVENTYGTRDAASNGKRHWQEHVKNFWKSAGTQLGISVSPGKAPSFRNNTW